MIAWQDPPPYIQYAEEAAGLARMTLAAGACDNLGYTVSRSAGEAEVSAYTRRAVIDRIGAEHAVSTYSAAVDRETADWSYMLIGREGLTEDEEEAAMADGARFVAARCQSASEQYPGVVIADGDEATTAVQVIDRITETP